MCTVDTLTPAEVANSVLDRLAAAWNAGSGTGYGAAYAEQATFVNVNGEVVQGRAAIAGGHAGIFASIYRDSRVRYEPVAVCEWSPDVIHVVARGTLDVPHGPLAGTRDAVGTHVLVRRGADWEIASTQNTLVQS